MLSSAGISNAVDETMWIMESALGLSRLTVHVNPDRVVPPGDRENAMSLFQRRVAGEPLQYVLGTQEFYGLEFTVNTGVLIPRPETELLVDEVLSHELPSSHPVVVDVGTGSGCLAVALAVADPNMTLYATDCCGIALAAAEANAVRHHMDRRVTFLLGDLCEPLRSMGLTGQVSAMVSNLPYIPSAELATLPREVREFEPNLALDGGADGLVLYRRLLRQAGEFLKPGGILVLESGYAQAGLICEEAVEQGEYSVRHIRQDFSGIERVIYLERRA